MRWDDQRVEREDESRLFGLAEEAVVRTFDAPEAMGVNFHEVRAKSALNRVPGGRYGFGWTVNAFRGPEQRKQATRAVKGWGRNREGRSEKGSEQAGGGKAASSQHTLF